MNEGHAERVTVAQDAINRIFDDTSVGRAQTRESLEELQELIDSLLATLQEDEDQ